VHGGTLALLLTVVVASACGKGSHGAKAADGAVATDAGSRGDARDVSPEDPLVSDLWARAADGDADDLARLCDTVGSDALIDATPVAARRMAALRALAYTDDFTPLPFLAKVATTGTDEEATAAMDSAAFAAARPRRATDEEDALEVHEGSVILLALAKDPTRPPARRVLAIRVLRLLVDRGWVSRADVPTDLDAR
jgi:hypothetical protein